MIAHVAEAGEDRGRVVLRFGGCGAPSRTALAAAVHVARAYGAEIETVLIEDPAVLALPDYPFAAEILLSGRVRSGFSRAGLAQSLAASAAALNRDVAALARAAEVRVRRRVLRAEPLKALAMACADSGPWNVVALAEPLSGGQGPELAALFHAVADTTAVVGAGPAAYRTAGPVVAVVEDIERLAPMLRVARTLAGVADEAIRVIVVGETGEQAGWLEAQVRLALDDDPRARLDAVLTASDVSALPGRLRRLGAGFVIAQVDGALVPAGASRDSTMNILECPIMVVR